MAWCLVLACLALNALEALDLGMDQSMPCWVVDAMPVVLSAERARHCDRYTGLESVRGCFREYLENNDTATLNARIQAIISECRNLRHGSSYAAGCDDKGIIDFVRLAFHLFHFRAESPLWLYGVLLSASALVFLARFGRQPGPVALVVALLLGHLCVLPVVAINPQLRSVLALRFMPALGMVATLHLVLETLAAGRWTVGRCLGALAQAALVLFVLHIRFSAAWQLVCVAATLGVVCVSRVVRAPTLQGLWGAAVPAVILGIGFVGLRECQKEWLAPGYTEPGGATHVFWHSVHTGLAFHPDLARDQRLRVDDWSIHWATGRYLHEEGRDAEWEAMGGTGLHQPDRVTLHFEKYDQAVREMFFALAWQRPGTVLASMLYYKPVAWAGCVGWLMRLCDHPDTAVLWPGAAEEFGDMGEQMETNGRFVKPWRWESLAVLGLLACWGGGALRACRWWQLGVAGLFTFCSLLPVLLGYPTPHTIGDGLIALLMIIGAGTAVGLVSVAARLRSLVSSIVRSLLRPRQRVLYPCQQQ